MDATDELGRVRSAKGTPYAGLRVADMSLAADLPSLNTQGVAALFGYHIASTYARAGAPATCAMHKT